MKNQKNNFRLTLALGLFISLFAQLATAQNITRMKDKTPEERAKFQTSLMKTKLSLDSTQLTQIQAINLKYALKNDPILKSDGSKLSKFKQLKSLQKEKDGELKKIFTAEQYKRYQAFEAELKDKMKEKMSQR